MTWGERERAGFLSEAGPGLEVEQRPSLPLRLLGDGAAEALAELDRFHSGDHSDRVQTGIRALDRKLGGGLRRGTLTLIGAPSGGGKTSLVQQVATHAAERGGVLLVSPEMGLAELAEREIIRRSRFTRDDRAPWEHDEDMRTLATTAHMRAEQGLRDERLPVYVLDSPEVTMDDVEDAARRVPALALVLIDYAQQVATPDERRPRYLQVGDVGTRAVRLAGERKVPVVVASQVNVVTDKGGATSYTFRETAILEQKAHTVIVLSVEWGKPDENGRRNVERAEMRIAKQRSGALYTWEVSYEPRLYEIREKETRAYQARLIPPVEVPR